MSTKMHDQTNILTMMKQGFHSEEWIILCWHAAGGFLNTVWFPSKSPASPLTRRFQTEASEIRNCFLFVSACFELHHDCSARLSFALCAWDWLKNHRVNPNPETWRAMQTSVHEFFPVIFQGGGRTRFKCSLSGKICVSGGERKQIEFWDLNSAWSNANSCYWEFRFFFSEGLFCFKETKGYDRIFSTQKPSFFFFKFDWISIFYL